MGYTFLEEEATADVAFEAWGATLDALCEEAAAALTRIMVENPGHLEATETRSVEHREPDVEQVLMRLLEDIIFYKDADQLLVTACDITVEETSEGCQLTGTLHGTRFNPEEQVLGTNPKAVSWHHYTVEKEQGEWRCHVIVDV